MYTYKQYEIDISKLKRDYINNPLRLIYNNEKHHNFKEMPYIEDLMYLYYECHMSKKDISELLQINHNIIHKMLNNEGLLLKNSNLNEKFNHYNIDIERLSRNYITEPLKRGEYMSYNDFWYLYIEKNLSRAELSEIFGLSLVKISRHQKIFNIHKEVEMYRQNTLKTNMKKYGVKYPSLLSEIWQKTKETNMKKYGYEWNTQKNMSPQTFKILSSKELLEKYIKENHILNGVQLSLMLKCNASGVERKIREYGLEHLMDYSKSMPEIEIRNYIKQYFDIECNTKKYLSGKEIDIYIPKKKIGIEFNGNYWHNEFHKEKNYHQEKSLLAEEKGIFIYHIFEYEWNTKKEQILNQLNNLLGINQENINFSECQINDEENDNEVKISLIYNDNDILSIKFQKDNEWRMLDFEVFDNIRVRDGERHIFEYFCSKFNPDKIICYTDIGKCSDKILKELEFKLYEIEEPNFVWIKQKIIKENKLENKDLQLQGYYKVYNCGNKKWIWKK